MVLLTLVNCVFSLQKTFAQTKKTSPTVVNSLGAEKPVTAAVANSAAFAEIYAGKVEAEADLKVLTMDLTEDAAQVREKKLERDLLARAIRWLEALPAASQPKLTMALGRLAVRKAQAEANLKTVSQDYADEHPTVKKARARLAVYNSELEKLLQ